MDRCKLTITDRRNRLKSDVIESIECLHSWTKNGIVKGVTENLKEQIEVDMMDLVSEHEE